jgi:hypothetical protein
MTDHAYNIAEQYSVTVLVSDKLSRICVLNASPQQASVGGISSPDKHLTSKTSTHKGVDGEADH